MRQRFFTPRLRFKSCDEFDAWLRDQCVSRPRRTVIPADRTDDLGSVRGGTAEAHSLCGSVRWLPCSAGVGLEDLPGSLR